MASDTPFSEDIVKRVLISHILNRGRPDTTFNIKVRYTLTDIINTCLNPPLHGYIQSKQTATLTEMVQSYLKRSERVIIYVTEDVTMTRK